MAVSKVGSEFLVNTETANTQALSAITGLANGGFVVTWQDDSGTLGDSTRSIKAQVYSADGAKVGSEFLVNTQTQSAQALPMITGLVNGGFVITWYDASSAMGDGSGTSVKAQVYGADGTRSGTELLVNTQTANNQQRPRVTDLTNGDFVITWQDASGTLGDSSGDSIKAQLYRANGTKLGGEFLVNTQTAGNQQNPTISGLANGGFVVTWQDFSGTLGDFSGSSVKAQVFSASGAKVGTEFLVNTLTDGSQNRPTITDLTNGGFVVTWASAGGIKAQIYDAGSVKVGSELLASTQATGNRDLPSITGLAGGGFVITWQDLIGSLGDGSGYSVKAEVYRADGTKDGSEFLVNTETASSQSEANITGLANGGFVVTWSDNSGTLGDSSLASVKARIFSAQTPPVITIDSAWRTDAVSKAGAELQVNTQTSGGQGLPKIANLANGGFVVTWADISGTLGDSSRFSIKAQIYGADGAKVSSEFLVNTQVSGDQYAPTVTGLATGGFVVTWTDYDVAFGDGSSASVKAQVFSADGTKVGRELLINTQTLNAQWNPTITSLVNGGFVVTWQDISGTLGDVSGSGIKAQVFDASGGRVGSEFLVNTQTSSDQTLPTVTSLANGGFVVSWQDNSGTLGDASGWSVKAQVFGATGTKIGSEFLVNTQTADSQTVPSITALKNGGFVVSWTDSSLLGDGNGPSIKAQVFDANGGRIGGEILVNTNTSGIQFNSEVAGLPNGGFVVTWADFDSAGGDGSGTSIKGQAFDANGSKIGAEFRVNTTSNGDQTEPSIAVLADGRFAIAWQDTSGANDTSGSGIRAQIFGSDVVPISVAENTTPVTSAKATDPDPGTKLTWSVGGTDGALFDITSDGVLTFKTAPNFEASTDAGADRVYDVVVTVSDGTLSDSQSFAITVTNVDEVPVITTNGGGNTAAVSVAENGTAVTTVAAADPEAAKVTYSISGGADAAQFDIDATTGALRFKTAPDFETRADAGANNVYNVNVTASDGGKTDTQAIAVTVTNVDEAPVITTNGGGNTAAVSVAENGTAVTTVRAADPEAAKVTYSISGGADAALFDIDAATGALRFKTAPDFETRADAGADNVYDVIVTASDGSKTDAQAIAVTVTNVDEAPVITIGSGGYAAAVVRAGAEFQVNTQIFGNQGLPETANLANGGFVVTWADFSRTLGDDSGGSIKAQIFGPDGAKVGSEFLVNTQVSGDQYSPAVTGLATGGFVVTWRDFNAALGDGSGSSIKAQVFSADGTKVGGEFLINTQTLNAQSNPTITSLVNGSFVVSWEDLSGTLGDGSGSGIKAQVFDASGGRIGTEFLVNTQTFSHQALPTVTGLANGGFVVSWQDSSQTLGDASPWSIKAQVFSATGAKVGSEFLVNTQTADSQSGPSITALQNGGFVISWADSSPLGDGSSNSVKAQVFSADGTKVGGELLANTNTNGTQNSFEVASQPNGGFVVTWVDFDGEGGDGSGASVKGQAFNADGSKIGAEFLVNSTSIGDQTEPSIAVLADGRFAIAWQDGSGVGDMSGSGIKAQIFSVDTALISVAENTAAVTTAKAVGSDAGAQLTWSVGGTDGALFDITSDGALVFKAAPDFEAPNDTGADGVYNVVVKVSDGMLTDSQAIAVTVTNVNEAPVITSGNGGDTAVVSIAEKSTAVTTIEASDPDAGANLVYAISGGADAGKFVIDEVTGALSFISAPDFNAPTDEGGDNVYDVTVSVSDGALTDTQDLAVTVTYSGEAPKIISDGNVELFEIALFRPGQPEDPTPFVTRVFTDPAGSPVTYAITGGADADLFSIDPDTGNLLFRIAPDFEASADAGANNVYDVNVTATNAAGQTDTQALAITVRDRNEAPMITSGLIVDFDTLFVVDENSTDVTTVVASDPEGTAVTYAITGGDDAALFEIDQNTGALRLKAAVDFEASAGAGTNNDYHVSVTATDATGQSTRAQDITVRINDVDEAPVITSNGGSTAGAVSVGEYSTDVTTIRAVDPEGAFLTYAISGGADADKFLIDETTGVLSFITAPNFNAPTDQGGDNVYDVAVSVSDGTSTDTQALAVTIIDEFNVYVPENSTAVTTVEVRNPGLAATTFAITGGTDADLFEIDRSTGALRFKTAPDFEVRADRGSSNQYAVMVTATDASGKSETQKIWAIVTDIDEVPVIISNGGSPAGAVSVGEYATDVTTVRAVDPEGAILTYTISGGADADKFVIDETSGRLSFISPPNFRAPTDQGGDNVYDVTVSVSDGEFNDTQALAVTVTGGNAAPSITSDGGGATATVTVAEKAALVTQVVAIDPDEGSRLTYGIGGGLDADKFTIDPATGELTFKAQTNVAAPGDADGDNVYDVIVTASDGTSVDKQALNIEVLRTIYGTERADTLRGTDIGVRLVGLGGNDVLIGFGGNDRLEGGAGKDRLSGGTGNDRLDGGIGADKMNGGAGDDVYFVDTVGDMVAEGTRQGNDTVYSTISFRLASNVETLVLTGSNAINGTGNSTANTLRGNTGANVLNGGAGNDLLSGGLGNDTLIGGRGADTFLFDSLPNGTTNVDLVSDFSWKQRDQIQLSKAVFAGLGSIDAGSFLASATATSAQDGNDRLVYNTVTGQLFYDADGVGGQASVQIATIGASIHPVLAYTDFQLVA